LRNRRSRRTHDALASGVCQKRIKQKLLVWKIERDNRKYRPYGYDATSPMVQRFQYLAGIRGDLYTTTYSQSTLRDRFNRVRLYL
jgi:hypothetical protein